MSLFLRRKIMISRINFSGLKGQERSYELGDLTLITGRNGSGKTTALQAVMLAFLGYEPRLGKRLENTMALASGGKMWVELLTEDGFGVRRTFALDGAKGTVSQEILLHGSRHMLQKEAEAEVAAKLGNFPVMFDVAEFTGMSPEKRRDFIFHLSRLDERRWNGEAVLDDLLARSAAAMLGNDVVETVLEMGLGVKGGAEAFASLPERKRRECAGMLLRRMDDASRAVLAETLDDLRVHCDGEIQDSLAAIMAALKERAKSAKAKKAESEAAVRALAEEHARLAGTAEGLEGAKADLARAEEELNELRKDAARREGVALGLGESEAVFHAHAESLAEKRAELKKLRGAPKGALKRLEARRLRMMEALAKTRGAEKFSAKMEALAKEMSRALSEKEALAEALAEVQFKWRQTCEEIEREKEALAVFASGRCPTCGTPATGRTVAAHIAKRRKALNSLEETLAQFDKERRELMAALKGAEKRIHGLEVERGELVRKRDECAAAAMKLREGLTAVEHEMEMAAREAEFRQARIDALEEEITRMELCAPPQPVECEAAEGADSLMERLADCEMRAAALRSLAAEKEKAAMLAETIERRMDEARRGMVEHEVLGDLTEAARGLRDSLMREVLSPLRERVDELLGAIDARFRSYFSLEDGRGKEGLEFGLLNGHGRVPFESLSGGERVLFSAALAAALVLRAEPPQKVLLVEMGELDEANSAAMLRGLRDLRGYLDNVVAVSCHDAGAPEGWNRIELD